MMCRLEDEEVQNDEVDFVNILHAPLEELFTRNHPMKLHQQHFSNIVNSNGAFTTAKEDFTQGVRERLAADIAIKADLSMVYEDADLSEVYITVLHTM
jgi:hypothetical protein